MALELNNVVYMFLPFMPAFRALDPFASIEPPAVIYCHIDMAFGGACEASIIIGYYADWATTRSLAVVSFY